jgi:hypothetical protein
MADPAVIDMAANLPNFAGKDFVTATINSLLVILVTEIGDKTFFIAAV